MENKFKLLQTWLTVKYRIHMFNRHPFIKEGEVWWCNFGENVGVEMNGKHELSLRPVVIIKKYNQYLFFGLPLTTQVYHMGSWYAHFKFRGAERVCVLDQGRSLSVNRLHRRIGEVDEVDLYNIRKAFLALHT